MQGRWHTGNCHGRAVVATIAAVIVLAAACAAARAVAAIPWYVWTAITATVAAVVIGSAVLVVMLVRSQNLRGEQEIAAVRAQRIEAQQAAKPVPQLADSPALPLPAVQRQALEAPGIHYHYEIHYHGESSPVRAQTGEEL